MGTINTRISIRSSNTFRNTISQRHDRTFAVEPRVDSGVRIITATTTGTAQGLIEGANYYDAAETGDTANQVYVFIRNTSGVAGKVIFVKFLNASTNMQPITLNAGEFTMFPWNCASTNDDIEVFSNDSNGVKVEYIVSPMQ
jgi:hypothetical protein